MAKIVCRINSFHVLLTYKYWPASALFVKRKSNTSIKKILLKRRTVKNAMGLKVCEYINQNKQFPFDFIIFALAFVCVDYCLCLFYEFNV